MGRHHILIIFMLFIGFCSYSHPVAGREVVDQIGLSVTVPETIHRVVSLAPSLTEIVYALELEGKLVGVTQFSNYPPAAGNLPRVGSYVAIDIERVVALQPDLCLATKDGNPKNAVDRIKDLGIPVYTINPHSMDEIIDAIVALGELLGNRSKAERIVDDMKSRIAAIRQKVNGPTVARPTVFFQIDSSPIISAGPDTFTHRLITMAGGINLAASRQGYPRFSIEDVLLLQPDIIIIASMAGGQSEAQLLAGWQDWVQIPAVSNNRVYVVSADLFDRPTHRLVEGLEALAPLLHPEIFRSANGR